MRPVFIGGCGRSGTTLLGSMLGGHSRCLTIPEAQFIYEGIKFYENKNKLNIDEAKEILNFIENHWRFKIWGLRINKSDICLKASNSYSEIINKIINQYGKEVNKSNFDLWINHTPENIRYIDTLMKLFPDAKFIHLVRDGRAVYNSWLSTDWGPNTAIKAAHSWLESISFGLAAESFLGESLIKRIRYEDLILNSEKTIKDICDFLNIDYQEDMLEGKGFKVPSYTICQHKLVGKKPDKSRLYSWKNKLSTRDVEIFEYITGECLLYLGYDLIGGINPKPLTNFERIQSIVLEIFKGQIVNRFKRKRRIMHSIKNFNY